MHDGTSRRVRMIIAKECGLKRNSITNSTQFMSNHALSYFACVDTLFTLQRQLHVSLPESNYYKYQTVGGLINDIVNQLKTR